MPIGRNVPSVTVDAVTLQWANGKTVARSTLGSGRFVPLVGFHTEVRRDDDLDRRLHQAGTPRIEIKHQRQGGAEIVQHWYLGEDVAFHPVTSGPPAPTMVGCLQRAADTAAAGIGIAWPQGERSRLAVRGYVAALVRLGYVQPVQLAARSRMTDVLLACLVAHTTVCAQADTIVDRARHPDVVTCHEIALPLAAGEEQEWGRGDTTTVTPFTHTHPETVDASYLRGVWRHDAIHSAAHRDWDGILTWSAEYARDAVMAHD